MRKLTSIILLFLFSGAVKAQFIVDSIGNVGMKASTDPRYTAFIGSTSSTMGSLHITRIPTGNYNPNYPWSVGIYTRAVHNFDIYTFGIRAQATPDSYLGLGRCFGVYGEGTGATPGYNYGVYGVIGSENGAGVYGSTVYDMGQALNQRYAGYFRGPVKVQGDLTVTGNISGVMVSAPSPQLGSASINASRNITSDHLADQLTSLDVSSFFLDIPEPSKNQAAASDTAEVKIPLTAMEEQVLSKQHYGLDAEQLEVIFPDLVYENEDGTKSINYIEMVPILVQAIKELSAKVEILEGGKAMKRTKKATNVNAAEGLQVLTLGQNKPNPCSSSTAIAVTIPESVQTAALCIYDLNGKKQQEMNILVRGKQAIQLDISTIADGMYLYSLIADGQMVQTRRMIIEKK